MSDENIDLKKYKLSLNIAHRSSLIASNVNPTLLFKFFLRAICFILSSNPYVIRLVTFDYSYYIIIVCDWSIQLRIYTLFYTLHFKANFTFFKAFYTLKQSCKQGITAFTHSPCL